MIDNGVKDEQLTEVDFTMAESCFTDSFEVQVCYNYNYSDRAEELPNLQELCDDNLHSFTCI